jgi:hypothetical protein
MPTIFGELSMGSPRRRIAAIREAAISNAPFCRSSVLSFDSDTARIIYHLRLLFAIRKTSVCPNGMQHVANDFLRSAELSRFHSQEGGLSAEELSTSPVNSPTLWESRRLVGSTPLPVSAAGRRLSPGMPGVTLFRSYKRDL